MSNVQETRKPTQCIKSQDHPGGLWIEQYGNPTRNTIHDTQVTPVILFDIIGQENNGL